MGDRIRYKVHDVVRAMLDNFCFQFSILAKPKNGAPMLFILTLS